MSHRSATAAGFRILLKWPSVAFAEIAWRWSFGAALLLSLAFCFQEYLGTLPVDRPQMFLLGTRQPALVAHALEQIFRGSAPRLIATLIVIALVFMLGWAITASLGRAAVVRALSAEVQLAHSDPAQISLPSRPGITSLISLHLLRIVAALALVTVGIGGWAVAGDSVSRAPAWLGAAFTLLFAVYFLAAVAWLAVNWFLSFAAIFVVAEEKSLRQAVHCAADLCVDRFGAVLVPGIWFVICRGILMIAAAILFFIAVSLAGILPAGVLLGILFAVALVYWLVADWFYVARLAAYVHLIQNPPAEIPPVQRFGSQTPPSARQSGRVDPDELILSDIP